MFIHYPDVCIRSKEERREVHAEYVRQGKTSAKHSQ